MAKANVYPLIGLLTGSFLLLGCTQPPPPRRAVGAAPVRVAPVVRKEVAVRIPTVGTVVPIEVSRVAAGAAGTVIDYPLREGALVTEGDKLAALRTVALEIQIAEAQAVLTEKQQNLAELQAGLRPEEIAQAKARMQSAEAESKYSQAHADRVGELASRPGRSVTDREVDEAEYDAERARQAFAEAKADYELKVSGYRPEQIAAAKAAADAQQKVVENLQDELARMTITAPFTGYLVEKHTEVGEWVQMGGSVATVARLDEVEVQLNVEESLIHEIRIGQQVDVRIDALGSQTISGTVNQIVPRSEWGSGSRSFPVIVRMQNTIRDGRPALNEGMVARVVFSGEPREALLADKDAVVRSSGKPLVYVAELKPETQMATVRPVEVTEGLSEGQYVEVAGELQEGDLLVTEGVERLHPYDEVEILDLAAASTNNDEPSAEPEGPLLSAD